MPDARSPRPGVAFAADGDDIAGVELGAIHGLGEKVIGPRLEAGACITRWIDRARVAAMQREQSATRRGGELVGRGAVAVGLEELAAIELAALHGGGRLRGGEGDDVGAILQPVDRADVRMIEGGENLRLGQG